MVPPANLWQFFKDMQTNLWPQILKELEINLSGAIYKTWVKGKTTLLNQTPGRIEIGCNSSITKDWLETRYYTQIKNIADQITGTDNSLIFTVTATLPPSKKRVEKAPQTDLFGTDNEAAIPAADWLVKTQASNLNFNYTFASFVVGSNNRLAHAVGQAIIANPAKAYNPFVIYGGVGVGKTHLMQAIGQEIIKNYNYKVLYCTSEAFTNEMIEAIQEKKNSSFRNKYRGVDVLLIDDIQFIAGRETTQEEFFHTFNELHSKGKQIIMTSDRPPKDIAKLEARLRSRFEGGMIADIQNPDIDMRQAILLSKCRARKIELPPEIITFLAENITASIRDLEGSLIRVITHASLTNQPVSLELAKAALGSSATPISKPKIISPKKVLDVVCTYFEIKQSELKGSSRQAQLVLPRQIAMYLLRKDLDLQFMRIANLLGKKDHTTVIHGVKKVDKNVENDTTLRGLIEDIRTSLWTLP